MICDLDLLFSGIKLDKTEFCEEVKNFYQRFLCKINLSDDLFDRSPVSGLEVVQYVPGYSEQCCHIIINVVLLYNRMVT